VAFLLEFDLPAIVLGPGTLFGVALICSNLSFRDRQQLLKWLRVIFVFPGIVAASPLSYDEFAHLVCGRSL